MALVTTTKDASSMNNYFTKMNALGYEMVSGGHKLEHEELISFIRMGLSQEYDSVCHTHILRTKYDA